MGRGEHHEWPECLPHTVTHQTNGTLVYWKTKKGKSRQEWEEDIREDKQQNRGEENSLLKIGKDLNPNEKASDTIGSELEEKKNQ